MTRLPPVGVWVDIRYRRLARPEEVYRQLVLDSGPTAIVTYQPRADLPSPVRAPAGIGPTRTILEPGSPVIWFTFPGAWHDIGLFHLADGTPTGIYANVLTPVTLEREPDAGAWSWSTTDLCLDVWIAAGRGTDPAEEHPPALLDEDELDRAEAEGAVSAATAERARNEAAALVRRCRAGTWPPPVVREWSLGRLSRSASGAPVDAPSYPRIRLASGSVARNTRPIRIAEATQ